MKDGITVVNDGELLHLIKDEDETLCGNSYEENELETRERYWAGVWCADCITTEKDEKKSRSEILDELTKQAQEAGMYNSDYTGEDG